ncbi:TetR/AcrR family transcriptional regulator [Sedimentitalea sp. JM2-8]|uniref:TetR/AcrR family transcriptional regulator n=1 Tax=Sedimentitalea xiamensis TaxID=3050037 RepID=A0ABT7FIM1_9RHOB|nr:TetR/AcrR family transcriptional regulator [Sedimentitalea xiamensis]MDK3074981.1 TetR/AcrR family transcriptional regulator [Sedimentitalea xiamensis]
MKKRAAAQEETRERIIQAAVALHDEKGIVPTTLNDIAARAGVGAATVLRHFPDTNTLVMACGQHVAAEMAPPRPEDAPALFAGLATTDERLSKLVRELHAFYARGRTRIEIAEQDRTRVEALDQFLTMLDDSRKALLRTAMEPDRPDDALIAALMALSGICVWKLLRDGGLSPEESAAFHIAILRRASEALADAGIS